MGRRIYKIYTRRNGLDADDILADWNRLLIFSNRYLFRKAMSMPHASQTSTDGASESWLTNARKQFYPDRVDWSVSCVFCFEISVA